MDSLKDSRPVKGMYQLPDFTAVLRRVDKLRLSLSGNLDLHILIYVAVGVAGDGDWLCPVCHTGNDTLYENRGAENGSVQYGPDRAVRALPHLFQVILRHSCGIRSDGGAFYRNSVLFCCLGAVNRYLVVRLVPVRKTQIIILCFQINIRKKKLVLYHFPQNTGHLIPIHFHQRSRHFDFFHCTVFPFFQFSFL